MGLVSAGIMALTIGSAVKSGATPAGSADGGLSREHSGFSVFGTIHPKLFELRWPVGAEVPGVARVRVASLGPDASLGAAEDAAEDEASFEDRFIAALEERRQESGGSAAGLQDASADPLWERFGTFAKPLGLSAADILTPDLIRRSTASTAARQPASRSAASVPVPARKPVRVATADARIDLPAAAPAPEADNRTAIYDISARVVYLPNGAKLEAHSGLGEHLDDVRYVSAKNRGPTPPNVYQLSLRERPFHGVRALRLTPVGDGEMYGRAGILAHSYMLGPNGQSNGCVSFKDYQAFLNAYLKGDIERLVVVEHLGTAPEANGKWLGWLPEPIRNMFKAS
jgi:Tlde1 domain